MAIASPGPGGSGEHGARQGFSTQKTVLLCKDLECNHSVNTLSRRAGRVNALVRLAEQGECHQGVNTPRSPTTEQSVLTPRSPGVHQRGIVTVAETEAGGGGATTAGGGGAATTPG